MPFQSEKQRRFLHANHPEIAKRWEREYATGGISNHFQRRPFKKGSWSRSYNPGAGGVVQHDFGPITKNGNGEGGGGHHPVYRGPTPAEIAAAKAKAEAEKRALEAAAHKKHLADFKDTQKKKVTHTKKIKDWVTTHPIETTASSLVPLGTLKAKEYFGDVSKINQWSKMGYGKGNPVPQKFVDTLKGSWVSNKTFEKLGHGVGSTKDWFFSRTSPKHFGPVESVVKGLKSPAVKALAKGIGTFGKIGTGPIGWATTAALSTPSVIEALTKREDDATESSLFGIDLTKNVNMANGGILDINESEEIISDDGNEIELTDYNAAFDDPNDFSTGVKSLFRAKDGGNVRLGPHKATDLLVKKTSTGERPKYQPPGHEDRGWSPGVSHSGSPSQDKSPGHPANQPSVSTKSSTQAPDQGGHSRFEVGSGYYGEPITKTTPDTGDWSGDVEEEFIGPRWESYNKKEWVNVELLHYEQALATQKKKMKNMGLLKLIPAAVVLIATQNPSLAMKTFSISPNDMLTVIKHSLPVMKAKKDLIAALEDYKGDLLKDVNIHNPNEMVNLEKTTDFTKTMNMLKDLTKKEVKEDTKDDGPGLPPQLGGPSTQEMATEYETDWMGAIREKQAQKKAYDEKIERERLAREKPIVSGTEMDIIALGNSGGLANLFRVKNQ